MSVQKKPDSPLDRAPRRSIGRPLSADVPAPQRTGRRPLPARTNPPTLRLVGSDAVTPDQPGSSPTPPPTALTATDPRWVLAMRAGEALQGTVLTPDRRRCLMRLASVMGLTAFDASLVLAIVQDQARRGHRPEHCAAAGADQLLLIPAPTARSIGKTRRLWTIAGLTVCLIGLQLLTVWWLIAGR
ncbi:MAG: hypothetical protein AAF750_01940 [Planctomycetota bacterium]